MIRDPDRATITISDEDIYAEVMKTHDKKGALRAFNTVLQIYSNNLKERIEMKNQNKKRGLWKNIVHHNNKKYHEFGGSDFPHIKIFGGMYFLFYIDPHEEKYFSTKNGKWNISKKYLKKLASVPKIKELCVA